VLIRNCSQRGGPGKCRSYWEDDIHVVVRQVGGPVFELRSEAHPWRRLRRLRVMHRNMLLPCDLLPAEPVAHETAAKREGSRRRRTTGPAGLRDALPVPDDAGDDGGAWSVIFDQVAPDAVGHRTAPAFVPLHPRDVTPQRHEPRTPLSPVRNAPHALVGQPAAAAVPTPEALAQPQAVSAPPPAAHDAATQPNRHQWWTTWTMHRDRSERDA
jgi:hypothetical protein